MDIITQTQTITLESLILNEEALSSSLSDYCSFFSCVERTLFNELTHNEDMIFKDTKRAYLKRFHIYARHFNSLWKNTWKRIKSIRSNNKNHITKKYAQIKSYTKKIKEQKDPSKLYNMHNKLNKMKQELVNLQLNVDKVSSVWGGKQFFFKQYNAEDLKLWHERWKIKRDHNLQIIGSHDESFGNQLCQLSTLKDLTLTLPYNFSPTHLKLKVDFDKPKKKIYNYLKIALQNKQALTWRIVQKENGHWYAQVSFSIINDCTNWGHGTLGIDLNQNLIATSLIDLKGNKEAFKNYKFELTKDNSDKNRQIMSDIVNEIVQEAKYNRKTITIEKLDLQFTEKNKYCSYVVTELFRSLIKSRCVKQGVLLIEVDPPYTSIIGGLKYAQRFGVSRHLAASYVIGRRGLNFVEKIPCSLLAHIPVMKQSKPKNTLWSILYNKLRKVSHSEKSILLGGTYRSTNLSLNP